MMSKHHILHERASWSARPEFKQLRGTPSLIPRIDRDVHDALHAHCPAVPILGSHAMRRVNMLFEPTGDTFEDIDGLSRAFDKATKHPRAHQLERDLAGLAIETMRLQIPYIREGRL